MYNHSKRLSLQQSSAIFLLFSIYIYFFYRITFVHIYNFLLKEYNNILNLYLYLIIIFIFNNKV